MWWISGKTTWWPFYLLILLVMGWYRKWQLAGWILFLIILITLTDQSSVHLFKNLVQRLRPCHEPDLQGLVHLVRNKCGGQYGFISSHAANAFGVATFTALWMGKRWITIVMIVWALLICYSRIYLGVHYPLDVIAGGLWGAGCAWLVFMLFNWVIGKLPKTGWLGALYKQ
jgi:undecaprenyl-diphosphatase